MAILDAVLDGRQGVLAGGPPDSVFELFAIEQILKQYDLADDELLDGQVGGGNDGGLDGVFTFLDGNLVREDSDVLQPAFDPATTKRGAELELWALQAKTSASFGEAAFEKAAATFEILLDLSRTEADLRKLFSERVVTNARIFRQALTALAPRHPRVSITFAYATKGSTPAANPKVVARGEELRSKLESLIYGCQAQSQLFGARELLKLHSQQRPYSLQLPYKENATSSDSHVAIVNLADYFSFITDENGAIRKYIFDWNVRDYEGNVEVNQAIRESLADRKAPEFWWLNNGVTVLCSSATISGRTFNLDDVQIVNGLQTSVTIYEHLKLAGADDPARDRSLLVRIIVTGDPATRDQVIRATNRQTAVSAASLRATDQIQRDLEIFFGQRGWYYERRKNFYKNQGRASDRIFSIPFVAQAMMAMGSSEPNNSRARPSSLIKKPGDYERLFDPAIPYDIYLLVATTQRRVDGFLRTTSAGASPQERTNLRFHLSMLLVGAALEMKVSHASQLRALIGQPEFDDGTMSAQLDRLRTWLTAYRTIHPDDPDKIAKSRDFVDFVLDRAFPASP